MSKNTFERNNEIIRVDDFGNEYVLDEAGNHRPPMFSKIAPASSGFINYETSAGHCGLCGKLNCHYNCFK